jgi:hypothetical protein
MGCRSPMWPFRGSWSSSSPSRLRAPHRPPRRSGDLGVRVDARASRGGGRRAGCDLIRDEVTADGERRSEWRLDWGTLTLHPDGSGTRETRHRLPIDGGEWEVTEQEWDVYWGEGRSHQVRLRLSLEGIVVINPPRPVIARVRDRGSRLVIPSLDPSSSRSARRTPAQCERTPRGSASPSALRAQPPLLHVLGRHGPACARICTSPLVTLKSPWSFV